MKVSIITVVYNNVNTIKDAINSVINQSYPNIEYIIIDGASTDGTIDVIKAYGNKIAKFISEPDKGLYDAMNKGIKLATGDVVGILNSDDFYLGDNVITKIVKLFNEKKTESIFADLVYVNFENLNKIVRYYDSGNFNINKFSYGWMPAHPTFFVKRKAYQEFGQFRTDLKIAADFDLLIRFLYINKLNYYYLPEPIIKMRVGGISTSGFKSKILLNKETLQVCLENGIKTNIFKILSKYPHKIWEKFSANKSSIDKQTQL